MSEVCLDEERHGRFCFSPSPLGPVVTAAISSEKGHMSDILYIHCVLQQAFCDNRLWRPRLIPTWHMNLVNKCN